MSKIVIFIVIVAVLGASIYFVLKKISKPASIQESTEAALPTKPWVEVLSSKVFQGERELQSGDELEFGKETKTDANGSAVIHFLDGSVARLDKESSLVIEEGSFDEINLALKVRMYLTAGRLWSRIIQLATPDSFWEVRTANAVATVRGTAFGIEYIKNKSFVLVAEDVVNVAAVDPATKETIKGTEIKLEEAKQVEIRKEDIKSLAEGVKKLEPEKAKEGILKSDWVQGNRAEDAEFDKKLDELKKQNLEEKEIRKELNKEIFEKAKEELRIESAKEEIKEALPEREPREEIKPEVLEAPEVVRPIERTASEIPASEAQKAVRAIEIVPPASLASVTEGDAIVFRVFAVMEDGGRKEITAEAKYQVIGEIGEIVSPGVFRAKLLSPLARETGVVPGQVVAVWKDPASGKEFLASTPPFDVRVKIEETTELRG